MASLDSAHHVARALETMVRSLATAVKGTIGGRDIGVASHPGVNEDSCVLTNLMLLQREVSELLPLLLMLFTPSAECC